jgi:flagella basal body P-ring formation protein FlgA
VPVLKRSSDAAGPAILRGDAVTISVTGGGFAVSQPGEAMEAGPVGSWIKVRPAAAAAKSTSLRARVVRPGLVELPLP